MSQAVAEKVTGALNQWLEQEIVNSDEGRNSYLSDYIDRRNDLFKPFSDPSNFQSQKARSHYDRFNQWVKPYAEPDFYTSDWFAGRLVFACLMEISGSYRKQCYFESEDANDYVERRYEQPVGIAVSQVVAQELASENTEVLADMSTTQKLDYIVARSLKTNDDSLELHKLIHEWAIENQKPTGALASSEDEPVVAMKEAQKLWVGLATAHIVVAASLRDDDYSKVPFLEPKSITDVTDVLYPLAA